MQNCGLRMRQECRERFPHHRLQRKLLVSDPSMHYDTCVTHAPWCMSGSLNHDGRESIPDIPGAYATRNCSYLVRGPWKVKNNEFKKYWSKNNTNNDSYHSLQGWVSSGRNLFLPGHPEKSGRNLFLPVLSGQNWKKVDKTGKNYERCQKCWKKKLIIHNFLQKIMAKNAFG